MRNALFALLTASFALSGCIVRPQRLDQAPRQTSLSAERVELPAAFVKGRPYVDLKINGKGPYRFLVDTGSHGTIITAQVARAVRISPSQKYTVNVSGASGQFEKQFMGVVEHIEAPGFSLGTVAVSIMSPQNVTLLDRHGDQPSGGIIGMSAFRDVLLEIDYPQHKICVVRPGRETLFTGKGILYTGMSPHVTIATPSARQVTTTALIDTGSDGGFEVTDIADYPVRAGLVKSDEYTQGIGGYWRSLFGQLAGDIRLGTAIWRDPVIYSAGENRIGSKALASWKLVVDQERKMLWLLDENQMAITTWDGPLEPDGRPAVYGFVSVPEGDGFLVKEVDSGGRAERAGLKVGDHYRWERGDPVPSGHSLAQDPSRFQLHVVRASEKIEINLSLLEPLPAAAAPEVRAANGGD